MHGAKSFLSSSDCAAVLIFDLFRVWKSKPLADRGFSVDRAPGNQNRHPVLIFDLLASGNKTGEPALKNNQSFLFKRPLNPLGFSTQKSKQSKRGCG